MKYDYMGLYFACFFNFIFLSNSFFNEKKNIFLVFYISTGLQQNWNEKKSFTPNSFRSTGIGHLTPKKQYYGKVNRRPRDKAADEVMSPPSVDFL